MYTYKPCFSHHSSVNPSKLFLIKQHCCRMKFSVVKYKTVLCLSSMNVLVMDKQLTDSRRCSPGRKPLTFKCVLQGKAEIS